MSRITEGLRAISRSIATITNPIVLLPLLLYLILKVLLTTLYLELPQDPFARLWALFVPGLTGEDLAHYPYSLLNMGPVLSNIDHILDILVLIIPEGATILLVSALAYNGKNINLGNSLSRTLRSYPYLVLAAAFSSAVTYLSIKLPVLVCTRAIEACGSKGLMVGTIAAILVQPLIVFILPSIILGKEKIVSAIKNSFSLGKNIYLQSLIIVTVSFLLTAPIVILELKSNLLAFKLSPEFLIQLQFASEIVEFLSLFILISGTTILYIDHVKITED